MATVFILNGLNFATLFSRVPDLRERLDLSNGALGLLLLSISVGSLLGLPTSGRLIERFGAAGVVRGGAVLSTLGLAHRRVRCLRPRGRARRRRSGSAATASVRRSGTSP